MKAKLLLKIAPIFLLFIFDFSLQNFNIISISFSKCSLYLFNPECITFGAFAINKILRLLLNLLCIKLILTIFKTSISNVWIYFIFIFIIYIFDMVLCFSLHPLFINWHKVLNPILYSPLAGVGLLAYFLNSKKKIEHD
jgi:hypothetical protein